MGPGDDWCSYIGDELGSNGIYLQICTVDLNIMEWNSPIQDDNSV